LVRWAAFKSINGYLVPFGSSMSELKAWFWADVSSRKQIHFAILEGFWVAIVSAGVTGLFAIADLLRSFGPGAVVQLLMAVLLGALGFGIKDRSRAAAVIAFSLFVLDRLVGAVLYGPRGLLFSIIFAVALLNGMRGCFAYHKLPTPPPGTPSLEEAFEAFRKVPNPPSD
jgi:hypothetical protein